MISTQMDGSYYVIRHFAKSSEEPFSYYFQTSLLPVEIQKRVSFLPVFKSSESIFYLTTEEENEAILICEKITAEIQSDYLFTEDLQRTYLTELIHFFLKSYRLPTPVQRN